MHRPSLHAIFAASAVLGISAQAQAQLEPQNVPEPPPPAETPAAPQLTRAPELLTFVTAEYPPDLLARGIGGEVLLRIDIDAQGSVERVEVLSTPDPALGVAAMAAATQFVFSPAEVDGRPAAIAIEYAYGFTPETPEPDAVAGERPALTPEEQPVNFSGLVREAGTRRVIAGAVVNIDGRPVAETDSEGQFAVRGVALGKHTVKVESRLHQAYEVEEEFTPSERLEAKYYLVKKSNDPFETVVRGRAEKREVAKVQLEREEVRKVPGTFGDPVRVIENLPGLARTPGGVGGALLVRGSYPGDSLVMIDGVPIPQLYHFGGLTSVVNAEFLDRIDFFPGGFGARYGRATAGVIDVVSRDTKCDLWRGSGEVSFMLAAAYLCAPTGTSDWSVAAAGRRSYIDVFLPWVLDQMPQKEDQGRITASPVFWDYQVKSHMSTGEHSFDMFAFGADDRLSFSMTGSAENVDVNAGIHLTSHRLLMRHRWRPQAGLTLTSTVAPGYTLSDITESSSELDMKMNVSVPIWTADWREDLTWRVNDLLTVNAGIDNTFGKADVEVEAPMMTDLRLFPANTFDFTDTQRYSSGIGGSDQGYWVEAEVTPLDNVKIVPGLRLDYFGVGTGKLTLSPRLTARWEIVKGSTLKGAYGVYQKSVDPMYLMDGFGNPDLDPERSQHFILGFEQVLTDVINLDVQAFYNLRDNLRSPTNTSHYENGKKVSDNWNNDGSGRSYGLEILLRHLATSDGQFYGWIAYTLSRAVQRDRRGIWDPNATTDSEMQEYPFMFDQTHILTVVGQWALPWGLEAGFRFRLVSGSPYTPLENAPVWYDADQSAYVVDRTAVERNSARLPTFHQLDVRIDKTITYDLWKLGFFLEVLNAYNASNVEAYQYDYRYRQKQPVSLLPIVPLLGIHGEF